MNQKNNRILYGLSLILAMILFSSCLDIDAEIEVSENGSGTLKMDYAVSAFAANLGRIENEQKLIAFPLAREDFERAAKMIDGLTLNSYSLKETAEEILISVEIYFASLNSLSRLFSTQDIREPIKQEPVGSGEAFTLFLYQGTPEKIPEDIIDLYKTLFENSTLEISCSFPREIKSSNFGTFSPDKRTVVFSKALLEIITSEDPVLWEILY